MVQQNRGFSGSCLLFTWVVCALMGGKGELIAQTELDMPNIKPGAYRSEGTTVSFRVEGLGTNFVGFVPSDDGGTVGAGILGFSVGLKIPVPERKSQIIPTVGMNLGSGFGAGRYGASRVELSTEWRHFPLGHDKDKKHDWEKPWLGAGANVGHRPFGERNFNPFHAGVFFKLGVGWIAFFTELGALPVLDRAARNAGGVDGIDPNARAFRYGFVLEF